MTDAVDYRRYDKAMLERIAMDVAKMSLIGGIYYGKIGDQEVRWTADGGIEVFTRHVPAPYPLPVALKPHRKSPRG